MAGDVLGQYGRFNRQAAHYEVRKWKFRWRGDAMFVRPPRSVTSLLAPGRDALFDLDTARRVLDASYETGLRCIARFCDRHPGCAAEVTGADRPVDDRLAEFSAMR
jgi:hypothetical protein